MSHFSLLVISDTEITEESLKETLQPWHEYGCDGIEDQYVIDVDVTDKVLKEFNKPQKVVILSDGTVHSRWDDKFYTKKPDPKEMFGRNEFELPQGAVELEMTAEEVRQYGIGYATMLQCAEEYYGSATQVGDRFFHKENVDKWSWVDASGKEVGRSVGNATLPGLRQGFASGEFLFGEGFEIEPARQIYVLQGMHTGKKLGSNTCTAQTMAPAAEIWFESIGVHRDISSSKKQMSNMQEKIGGETRASCGSLPFDGNYQGCSVSQLQSAVGECEGQSEDTSICDRIHNPVRKVLIGGTKWDWWQVGGRWTGLFRPNYDPNTDPKNQEFCWLCQGTGKRKDMSCENGCNGCSGTGVATKWPTQWKSVGDIAQIKNIPFEALRTVAELKALGTYDKLKEIIREREIPNWDKMLADNFGDEDKTRKDYWSDPVVKDIQKEKEFGWDVQYHLDNAKLSRTERAILARRQAIQTFAVVKDGKWYQRGEMGWFGCVSDEKDPDQWSRQFETLLTSLSPDTWLACVDCHT